MNLVHLVLFQFFPGAVLGAPAPRTTRRHPGYDERAERLKFIQRDDEEIMLLAAAVRRFLK